MQFQSNLMNFVLNIVFDFVLVPTEIRRLPLRWTTMIRALKMVLYKIFYYFLKITSSKQLDQFKTWNFNQISWSFPWKWIWTRWRFVYGSVLEDVPMQRLRRIPWLRQRLWPQSRCGPHATVSSLFYRFVIRSYDFTFSQNVLNSNNW